MFLHGVQSIVLDLTRSFGTVCKIACDPGSCLSIVLVDASLHVAFRALLDRPLSQLMLASPDSH